MNFFTRFRDRKPHEHELDGEIRTRLAMAIREGTEQSGQPAEAGANARREFGNVTAIKEVTREIWAWRWLEILVQDLRYGLRRLRRNPGFTISAIAIAALGIAATCVVFTFADAAIFRAMPYNDTSRVAAVSITDLKNSVGGRGVPVPVFLTWQLHAASIGDFAAKFAQLKGKTLVGGSEPTQVFDKQVSQGAFQLFGVKPLLGRDFQASDYKPAATRPVILSYPLWQHLFNGHPDVLGRTITLDGIGHTVVGIMPPGFLLPGSSAAMEPSCWTPLVFNAKQKSANGDYSLAVWTRLKRGISPEHTQATLGGLALRIVDPTGSRKASDWRIQVTPLIRKVVGHWRSVLIVLLGAVGFLLAIACANVANLLLAQADTRQKEIAVRTAVGASRARLTRQLLTETLVLSGIAGSVGILLAYWGIEMERGLLPRSFNTANFRQMRIDPRILAAAFVLSVAVGIIFSLAPAFHASKVDLLTSLKEGRTNAGPRRGAWTMQSVLVIVEVTLSLILLTGAALMLRSFIKLESIRPGFNPHETLTMRVLLPKYRYPKADDRLAAYEQLVHAIRALPGVQSAAFVAPLPMTGIDVTLGLPGQQGMSSVSKSGRIGVGFHAVSPDYFETMGIPLLRGRVFTNQDTHDSELVAIVDKAFVDRYWPGQNPVGKLFYLYYPKPTPVVRIVGEVGSIRDLDLIDTPRPEMYNPFTQHFFAEFAGTLIAKTTTPTSTTVAMERAIRSVDPEAPISEVETMRQVLGENVAEKRLYLLLVGVFAVLAVSLAAAGIASTVSYSVSQRRHETGIRMALGAGRSNVLFVVVGHTLRSVMTGILLGATGSFLLTQFIRAQLYEVSPTDPVTFGIVALILAAIALLACYIPARRAANVDPMVALRYE